MRRRHTRCALVTGVQTCALPISVVMDIHTGEILSLVSNPGFDPNWFNVGITQAQWKLLSTDKYKPLTNKAIQGQYPPGSTFKMMVGMAALESGAIDANTRVF